MIKRFLIQATPATLVRMLAAPYVIGSGVDGAVATARQLWDQRKIRTTIALLGESVPDHARVALTMDTYRKIIAQLLHHPSVTLSLKLTQLGIHHDVDTCARHVEDLVTASEAKGINVTIDMEDHAWTDATLSIFRDLKPRHPLIGTVLQSRLFRTERDIRSLTGLRARVRICIGIYNEPPEISLQDRAAMKHRLIEYLRILFNEGHYPEVATHDEALVRESIALARQMNVPNDAFEIQQLIGIPRQNLQDELVREGVTVRLYLPFSSDQWQDSIPYARRRLIANPKIARFTAHTMLHSIFGRKR